MTVLATLLRAIFAGLQAVIAPIATRERAGTEFPILDWNQISRLATGFGRLFAHWRNGTLPRLRIRAPRPAAPRAAVRLPRAAPGRSAISAPATPTARPPNPDMSSPPPRAPNAAPPSLAPAASSARSATCSASCQNPRSRRQTPDPLARPPPEIFSPA